MDSYNENTDYDKKYGPWNLAKRINKSVDIVTDLTDVVEEELPQKALQGTNLEATNTAILEAIQEVSEKIDEKLNFHSITHEQIDDLGDW